MNENWYCYVCGKPIRNDFFLFSLNDRTDRVFLCCSVSCKEEIDDEGLFSVNVVRRAKSNEI